MSTHWRDGAPPGAPIEQHDNEDVGRHFRSAARGTDGNGRHFRSEPAAPPGLHGEHFRSSAPPGGNPTSARSFGSSFSSAVVSSSFTSGGTRFRSEHTPEAAGTGAAPAVATQPLSLWSVPTVSDVSVVERHRATYVAARKEATAPSTSPFSLPEAPRRLRAAPVPPVVDAPPARPVVAAPADTNIAAVKPGQRGPEATLAVQLLRGAQQAATSKRPTFESPELRSFTPAEDTIRVLWREPDSKPLLPGRRRKATKGTKMAVVGVVLTGLLGTTAAAQQHQSDSPDQNDALSLARTTDLDRATRGAARTPDTTPTPTAAPTTEAPTTTTEAPTTTTPPTTAPPTTAPPTTVKKVSPPTTTKRVTSASGNYGNCSTSKSAMENCWGGLVSKYNWNYNTAINVMWCESRGNPNARNPRSTATGLFQILNGPTDPEANVALAYSMYSKRGWQPWVCKG